LPLDRLSYSILVVSSLLSWPSNRPDANEEYTFFFLIQFGIWKLAKEKTEIAHIFGGIVGGAKTPTMQRTHTYSII
jgi:hypothetical protein